MTAAQYAALGGLLTGLTGVIAAATALVKAFRTDAKVTTHLTAAHTPAGPPAGWSEETPTGGTP
jgi:hypothetical protein